MSKTYITPELIAQAQELIDKDRDYNFTASLPEGMALYSYEDGVWVVDTKDSCDMNDAVKIECVIAVNPEMKHVVLSKSDKASRAFFRNEKFAIIDSVTMKPIQSDNTIEKAQSNADMLNQHNIDNGHPGRYEVAIIDNV